MFDRNPEFKAPAFIKQAVCAVLAAAMYGPNTPLTEDQWAALYPDFAMYARATPKNVLINILDTYNGD